MPNFRETARAVFQPSAEATWTVFEKMSGGLSIPFGVLALLDVFSARQAFAVVAYLALWATVISLGYRLKATQQQRPNLLPWEVLEMMRWDGEKLLRLIADSSKPIPSKQPEEWISRALDCLREHAKDRVRRFKVIVELSESGFPTESPPEIDKRPFDESWTRARKGQWEKLNDCLDVFRDLEKMKPPIR